MDCQLYKILNFLNDICDKCNFLLLSFLLDNNSHLDNMENHFLYIHLIHLMKNVD